MAGREMGWEDRWEVGSGDGAGIGEMKNLGVTA